MAVGERGRWIAEAARAEGLDNTTTAGDAAEAVDVVARDLAPGPGDLLLVDAAQVANLAAENDARLIVVGQSFDEEGRPNLAGRRAAKFAEALKEQTQVPVVLWDEAFSTQDARAVRIELGGSRKKRVGHMDELAAVMILRSYLDSNQR